MKRKDLLEALVNGDPEFVQQLRDPEGYAEAARATGRRKAEDEVREELARLRAEPLTRP